MRNVRVEEELNLYSMSKVFVKEDITYGKETTSEYKPILMNEVWELLRSAIKRGSVVYFDGNIRLQSGIPKEQDLFCDRMILILKEFEESGEIYVLEGDKFGAKVLRKK